MPTYMIRRTAGPHVEEFEFADVEGVVAKLEEFAVQDEGLKSSEPEAEAPAEAAAEPEAAAEGSEPTAAEGEAKEVVDEADAETEA